MRENDISSSSSDDAMKHDLMVIRDVHCSTCSKLLGDDAITLPIKYVPERNLSRKTEKYL